MQSLESQFFEMYKSVDVYCKNIFNGTPIFGEDGKEVFGISAYIRAMEQTSELRIVNKRQWKDTYYTLKHLRWVRNRIAHEITFDEFKPEDYEKLKKFYDSLLSQADPLTSLNHYPVKKNVENYAPHNSTPKTYNGTYYSIGRRNVSNRLEDTSLKRIVIISLVTILGFSFLFLLGILLGD